MRKRVENQRSWKGQTESVVEPPRHRWQTEAGKEAGPTAAPLRKFRRTLAAFLLLSLTLLSAFVYLLLHAPIKTPMITVGPSNYVWPFPPNAWVKEDVDGLASLHGKVMHWRDSSKAWQTKSTCLEDLRNQLQESVALSQRAGAIILYFNMHGAVNEEGEACLIPPAASSLATNQWIKIEDLISTIVQETPEGVKVLLAFDCVHYQVDWKLAQLNNTFVDRLEEWAAKSCPESIVVLSACSSDQRSWSGPDLHSSIFGRQLQLGLAGEADRNTATGFQPTGNGDGEVSMRELVDYLALTVEDWAIRHRGVSQTPSVMPKRFQDFRLTWALKSHELARQSASIQHAELASATPSALELEDLWRGLDELKAMGLYTSDPKTWAELEHRLLWLEQLSIAGAGYRDIAVKQIFPSTQKQLKEIQERAKSCVGSNNAIAKANILQDRAEIVELPSFLPSIALQEYLGEIPTNSANTLRTGVVNASIDKSQTAQSVIASLGLPPKASQWNELNFLSLVKKYDCISNWPNHTVIKELLQLRNRCEQLAVQGDVRGHRWRRPAILNADRERRKAEDELILGPGDTPLTNSSENVWNGVSQAILEMESPAGGASHIESAWRLRDQGFAEIAYLANWICSPDTAFNNLSHWKQTEALDGGSPKDPAIIGNDPEVATPFFREELATQELKRLINSLHALSETLGSISEAGDGKLQQLNEIIDQVKLDLGSLKSLVNDHVERASRNSADPAAVVREVDALLALPFLAIDQRVALKKLMSDKLRENMTASAKKTTDAEAAADALRSSVINGQSEILERSSEDARGAMKTRYVDRLRNWGDHPLSDLMLLEKGLSLESMGAESDSKANDKERELNSIDVGNSRLRRCFQAMQLFSPSGIEEWCQGAGVKQTVGADANGWMKFGFAERYERAVVPLCPIQSETNNALLFRRLAFKDMLYWYANRTVDDFYADPTHETLIGSRANSYFERAVRDTVDYANTIPFDSGNMSELTRLIREKVQTLGPLARNGVQTSVKLGSPGRSTDRVGLDVDVMPTVTTVTADRQEKLLIPNGLAALMIRNATGIVPERRIGVPMPVQGIGSYKLTAPELDGALSNEAILVFRGHEFRSPMSVGRGIVVDFNPTRIDSAELVLFGETKRQSSIVFILDCSWSMGGEIPVEAIATKSQSRLELAKDNVLQMVTQLASRPDVRIGVRLFGHRLGWSRPSDSKSGSKTAKTQILTQPNYPAPIPNDLLPSRDVEAILPLGRFTSDMVGDLAAKLSKVVPWGQSPLYLSIIESLQDFDADDNTTAKSIVIITDGDNFQFNASGRPGGEPAAITSIESVYRAWNSNKVPLYILGVGVSNAGNAKARENLIELAERTDGKYYDIESGSDLLRALSEQLALGTYTVSKLDSSLRRNGPVTVGETKLNTPVAVTPVTDAEYQVSFQEISKSIEFQGGESLELYLTEDGRDIVSKPFDRASPRAATLVRQGATGRLIARVHRPSSLRNGINFPISIQDPDTHFTPRPSLIWIEATPVVEGSESPTYTYQFYDANFELKTPVPMVTWFASSWPSAATAADIRIWVKYEPTPNVQSITLEQVKQNPRRYSEGIPLNGVEGVSLSVNLLANRDSSGGTVLQVTEVHGERSKGVGSIRVGLETDPANVASRVTRNFEPDNGIAIHTFVFEESNAAAFLSSPSSKICIQTRSASHAGAWQLQSGQPIRVDVAPIPDLLPAAVMPINSTKSN